MHAWKKLRERKNVSKQILLIEKKDMKIYYKSVVDMGWATSIIEEEIKVF